MEFYEKRGWWAQTKKQGTCALIRVSPGRIQMMNRHQQPLHWTMPRDVAEFLHDHLTHTTTLVAELMHHKTVPTKNTLYLFDVLVSGGEYLLGTTYASRYDALLRMFPSPAETPTHRVLHPRVWLAPSIRSGFVDYFNRLRTPDDEGIVRKDPPGVLRDCENPRANSYWQVKCRRQTRGYAY